MINNNYLKKLYESSKKSIKTPKANKNNSEEDLLSIINNLKLNNTFIIHHKNNYNLNEVSKLFRFYENELKNSFSEDKIAFDLKLKCYLLIVELFTKLCILFSYNKEKRFLINTIFQILKESNNMLKLTIPFEKEEIQVLNNLIGQQLYYYTHIQESMTKEKDINYILEQYFLKLERIQHGYELSYHSNFGNNTSIKKSIEEMLFINNASFLLLKMVHKLNFYLPNFSYLQNSYFLKIKELFQKISKKNKSNKIKTIFDFESSLIGSFTISANYLQNHGHHNIFDDKIKLLKLNTDEYKQLIDIILTSKL
ncbi:MAG: hypothetical protein C0625_07025 [Arcobacter sp.]|nr:MAG: hypothetical protein C0625_07025 [Arcobacter sp.]